MLISLFTMENKAKGAEGKEKKRELSAHLHRSQNIQTTAVIEKEQLQINKVFQAILQ